MHLTNKKKNIPIYPEKLAKANSKKGGSLKKFINWISKGAVKSVIASGSYSA
jgi:hypothetical protein